MGMLWEAHQQGQGRRTDMRQNMQARETSDQVAQLTAMVQELEKELGEVIKYLETKFGDDVNADGQVAV